LGLLKLFDIFRARPGQFKLHSRWPYPDWRPRVLDSRRRRLNYTHANNKDVVVVI